MNIQASNAVQQVSYNFMGSDDVIPAGPHVKRIQKNRGWQKERYALRKVYSKKEIASTRIKNST
jgi:hypothetical protein